MTLFQKHNMIQQVNGKSMATNTNDDEFENNILVYYTSYVSSKRMYIANAITKFHFIWKLYYHI